MFQNHLRSHFQYLLVDNDLSYRRLDHRIFLGEPSPVHPDINELDRVWRNGWGLYQHQPDVSWPSMVRRDHR